MNIILIIIFLAVVVLAFLEDYLSERQKLLILAVLAVIMIIVAATKDIYHTADAETYMDIFYHNDDTLYEIATEPSYIYLSRLILLFNGPFFLIFLIYAMVTIPLKLYAMNKLTPYIFTALVIYIPVYYELHDLVQIRAAAAATFLMCSIKPLVEKKYIIAAGFMLLALFMHYSSICFFPLLLLSGRKLNTFGKWACGLIIPLGFAMYFTNMGLLSLIPSSLTGGKLDYYTNSAEVGLWDEMIVPYKNIFLMCKCLLLYVMLVFYDKIKEQSEYLSICIILNTCSIFIYLTLATVPTIATRVSDMYGIIDPLLFSFMLFVISPKYVTRAGLVVIGTYELIYHMVSDSYFF